MNANGTNHETPLDEIEHEPGIDVDAETYGDDEIHDPEFDALIMGIEAIARRVIAEWREATATPQPTPQGAIQPQQATAASPAQAQATAAQPTAATLAQAEAIAAEAIELEAELAEPEPGTSEYDDQHGIPFFELIR
jgi:hypothetical protein